MKHCYLAGLMIFLALVLVACYQSATPAVDVEATVQAAVAGTVRAAVEATLAAQPTDTPAPGVDVEATVVAAVEATLTARPAEPPASAADLASTSERPHRSYPAPTGYPGFRKYYQKRCYPGCHYDSTSGTPTPKAVHP